MRPARFDADQAKQHQVAERFIAARSGGDIETLMHLLDKTVAGYVDLATATWWGAVRSPRT